MKLFSFRICITVVLGIIWQYASSQKQDSLYINSSKSGIKLTNVRPAFFEFSYRTLPAINHYPHEDQFSNFEANKLIKVKLNVPLLLSKKLAIISQLRYRNEQLHLGNDLFENESDIHFDNLGMSFMVKYQFDNAYYIAGHVGGFFKSDRLTFERYSSILDYNSSLLLGKNLQLGSVGIGAIFGNSLGRFRLYPLFLFDYQLSNSWKLEMKLPKEIQLRRIITPDNFYLTVATKVNGASYFISQDIYENRNNLEYRRAAVDLNIGLEKEIIDMLWIGVDFGITQPIYSALVETGQPTRNKLFDFDHSFTPYGSISIYLVPPKSFYNKLK